jgi:bacterioferritin
MWTNPRIAGYLSQALSHEMSVVQQYLTQANLCDCWGMGDECAYFRREAGEELEHAGKIIRHMLTLGLAPNATHLEPVHPGRNMAEMLTHDWRLEEEAVRLYDDALRYAQRCRDEASSKLFADLLADEQAHLKELERMLGELAEKEKKHG